MLLHKTFTEFKTFRIGDTTYLMLSRPQDVFIWGKDPAKWHGMAWFGSFLSEESFRKYAKHTPNMCPLDCQPIIAAAQHAEGL